MHRKHLLGVWIQVASTWFQHLSRISLNLFLFSKVRLIFCCKDVTSRRLACLANNSTVGRKLICANLTSGFSFSFRTVPSVPTKSHNYPPPTRFGFLEQCGSYNYLCLQSADPLPTRRFILPTPKLWKTESTRLLSRSNLDPVAWRVLAVVTGAWCLSVAASTCELQYRRKRTEFARSARV